MLLMRIPSPPNRTAGRRIACEMPEVASNFSHWALPLKYGKGESSDGLVMLTWTIRRMPAALAAAKRIFVFWTAWSNFIWRVWNRIQYVL